MNYSKLVKLAGTILKKYSLSVPKVEQSIAMCGPASLKAVLSYFGVDKTEKELKELSGATIKDGVEITGLCKATELLEFDYIYKENGTIEDLKMWVKRGIPIIVEWFSVMEDHYSVVIDFKDDDIIFMDPEFGEKEKLPVEEFKKVWFNFLGDTENHEELVTGVMLVVLPQKPQK